MIFDYENHTNCEADSFAATQITQSFFWIDLEREVVVQK